MSNERLQRLLAEAIAQKGDATVENALSQLLVKTDSDEVLTIIANAGVHEIPGSFQRGVTYEASHGNWSADDQDALKEELTHILIRLATMLRSKRWKTVYLVPTGHPILSIQIKLMVYRILRLNTIDLYYKNGSYYEVHIDHREVALTASEFPPKDS